MSVTELFISIVIPTLDERESVKRLVPKLEAVAKTLPVGSFECIFVDDDSKDGTQQAILDMRAGSAMPIFLVERKVRGLATAVIEGFRHARGSIVGVIDADLSHPPELIPKMLGMLEGADIVVGSRHLPGGGVEEWPAHRRFFSRAASLCTLLLAPRVTDPMSGYFFLRKEAIQGVTLSPVGYKILLEILVKGRYSKVAEVPYIFRNRDFGKSKLNWKVSAAYFWHLAKLHAWKLGHIFS